MDHKSEIKARLPIEQLVGEYCQLNRKGRNFVSLCPFHSDTHPSFLISPDKGIAYCFACQTGGDIFNFYQAIENVDFPTAIRDLAKKTGVELPKEPAFVKESKDKKERLRACLENANRFFQTLRTSAIACNAYLATRNMQPDMLARFEVGYAPDSFSATYDHLLKNGFSKTEIIDAGLAIQKDMNGNVYDRFRNRVMFPIRDHMGNIAGFGGRALTEGDAKYINSPEGPLYSKSHLLYGLSLAKEALRRDRTLVLVEGYFDVIAAHRAGVENVAAVSGTALTGEHARLIKRYADTVVLSLDQDKAGKDAAVRAFSALTEQDVRVKAITIPAKDPDELVNKDPQLFVSAVTQDAVPFIEHELRVIVREHDVHTPDGRHVAMEKLLPLLAVLSSAVERESYIERIASSLGMSATAIQTDYKKFEKKQTIAPQAEAETTAKMESLPFSRFLLCIGLGILYPEQRPLLQELISSDEKDMEAIRTSLMSSTSVDATLIAELPIDEVLKNTVRVVELFCEENFSGWSQSLARREMKKIIASTNRDAVTKKQRKLIEDIRAARENGRTDEELQLLTQYQKMIKLMQMA